MGVFANFKSASLLVKIAYFFLGGSNFYNYLSFTTTTWGIDNIMGTEFNTGLWRRCTGVAPVQCNMLDGYAKVWFGMYQAFGVLGFVGVNVAYILITLYIYWESCMKNKEVRLACTITSFVAAGCWLVAVVLFGVEFEIDPDVSQGDDRLGYSFYVGIVSLVLATVGGILLVVDANKGSSTTPSS